MTTGTALPAGKPQSRASRTALWVIRIIPAVIMLQTLFFKFTGAEESVYIFTMVGIEPWGRFFTGAAELVAAVLLTINRYQWLGALLGVGIMAGALLSHLTLLGIEILGDGGYLFVLGIITFLCCILVLVANRHTIRALIPEKH